MKKVLTLTIGVAVLLGLGLGWLRATPQQLTTLSSGGPTIGDITLTPTIITAGVPTSIWMTAVITSSLLVPSSVNVLRLNGSASPTIIAQLVDDGTNGDVTAGDRVFSARFIVNQSQTGQLQLQLSAAFTGLLIRATSPIQTISVVQPTLGTLQYSNLFYQFLYPAQYSLTVKKLVTDHEQNAQGRDTYGFTALELNNTTSNAIDSISVQSFPNWGNQSISAILSTTLTTQQAKELPGDTVQLATIDGQSAVSSFFNAFDNGSTFRSGSRQLVFPTNDRIYVFEMTWSSQASNTVTSPVHTDFNTIINSFVPF